MNISRGKRSRHIGEQTVQFEIRTLESIVYQEQEPLVSQSMYTILWIHQGQGEILIDTDRFTIEEDTLYYIKSGQAFHAVINEPASGFLISFEREFIDLFEKNSFVSGQLSLFNQSWILPGIRLRSDMNIFLKEMAEKMLYEFTHCDNLRNEILSGFLKIFVIYLSRHYKTGEAELGKYGRTELANIFFCLLEKEFSDRKKVKDYASMMAVTPGYLNKVVRQLTGFTASYHIQQRLVLEAKRRLIFEGNNLKEISYGLGFCDPSHFSKFFKTISGTTFTDFKRTTLS